MRALCGGAGKTRRLAWLPFPQLAFFDLPAFNYFLQKRMFLEGVRGTGPRLNQP